MNPPETNPYLRKLDQIQAAQRKYNESEWRLFFLRTLSAEPPPQPTDEEICKVFTQTNPTAQHWN